MTGDLEQLTRLLRAELTVVHQQFFHMLALRQWGNEDLLSRITDVDTEDFKNAMQIIDLLVSRGLPVTLASHQFHPGSDIASILQSELRIERHFADILDAIRIADPDGAARANRAAAPRQAYREWLQERMDATTPEIVSHETTPSMGEFLAQLIALVEQAMLHAFLLWHQGRGIGADNAWRLSGAAMLYGTAVVRCGALLDAIPTPASIPSVQMAESASEAFDADMMLVRRCADLGRDAAEADGDDATRRTCLRIVDDCDLVADMKMDQDFPAVFGRSPVFESFAATRERHLN